MIATNAGFGDASSAAAWVAYTNGSAESLGGSRRARAGHPEPYGVRYWCVGNEMFGPWQLGFMAVWQYVIKHRLFAEAMWQVDPELVLVGVGDLFTINECDPEQVKSGKAWSERMLDGAADHMNLISEHFYEGRLPWTERSRVAAEEHIGQLKAAIWKRAQGHRTLQARVESLAGRRIPVAMDEWNYWHRECTYGELGCVYELADGLGVAMGLHEFFRNTDVIHMAHYAQAVNVIGAIKTTRIAAELEPTGLVLALYRRYFASIPVEVDGDFGELDVVAAVDEDGGRLTLGVVNPTELEVSLQSETPSAVRGACVTGPEPTSHNTPGRVRNVELVPLELAPGSLWRLPPWSCSVIEIEL
jgi:alpha-N-arabinofuranosidase